MNAVRSRKFLAVLLILLAVGYGFSATHRQLESGNDFPIYVEAARTLLAGRSPYDAATGLHGYVYLPFFALVISPLARMPEEAAVWIWYALNVSMTAAVFLLTRSVLAGVVDTRRASWAAALGLIFNARFFLNNYDMGQVNILILLLALLALNLAVNHGRFGISGCIVGILTAIKPYGAMLLIPFLVRGKWRIALAALAGFGIAAFVVPSAFVGPRTAASLLVDWKDKIILPSLEGSLQGSRTWDQSPQAALRRLTVDSPAFDDTRVNVFSISDDMYRTIKRFIQAGLLILLISVWFRRRREDCRLGLVSDGALAFLGMLTLFGYNLRGHFVLLLLPWAVAASAIHSGAICRSRHRSVALGFLALSTALIFLTAQGIIGRAASNWALAYSAVTLGTIIQLGLLVHLRLCMKKMPTG